MITEYKEFEELSKKAGVTAYRVCIDLGLNPHFFTWWKTGKVKTPRVENLKRITKYLEGKDEG